MKCVRSALAFALFRKRGSSRTGGCAQIYYESAEMCPPYRALLEEFDDEAELSSTENGSLLLQMIKVRPLCTVHELMDLCANVEILFPAIPLRFVAHLPMPGFVSAGEVK
jgi:hypothetical protein